MTDPNAKAVSYADVLKWAATTASVLANQYPWKRDAQKYLHHAAALRALAARLDQAIAPWILEMNGEQFATESGLWLLSALAAGYTPPEDGPR